VASVPVETSIVRIGRISTASQSWLHFLSPFFLIGRQLQHGAEGATGHKMRVTLYSNIDKTGTRRVIEYEKIP